MRTLIVYSTGSTFRPRSVVASLAADLRRQADEVTVLDIGDFSYVTQDLPPRWYARLVGHDVFSEAFERTLEHEGVSYLRLSRPQRPAPLPDGLRDEFDDAVKSEMVTYLNTDSPNDRSWFVRYSEKQTRSAAWPAYQAVREFLKATPFDRALIPNGRVPDQRLALRACRDSGVPVEFYEIGRALENSYYTGSQQVHDREGTQNEVVAVTSHLSDQEIHELASDWLATRMSSGLAIHPYNAGWQPLAPGSPHADPGQDNLAVFFSSSVDEFASYGGSWMVHEWHDQYEAFDAFITALETSGVRCVLRIHPNLKNKSRSYVQREITTVLALAAKHKNLQVIAHTDPTNSYSLLHASRYVIVGRSTLGLEGSSLGKSVWTTTAARYDTVADVRRALRKEDLTADYLSPWEVDRRGAERFVAYWVIQDHPFTYGETTWATWDTLRAPLKLKLGNLLLPNSPVHTAHLIRREIVKMLNQWSGRRLSRKLSRLAKFQNRH